MKRKEKKYRILFCYSYAYFVKKKLVKKYAKWDTVEIIALKERRNKILLLQEIEESLVFHETEQNCSLYLKSFWWFFLIFDWIIDFCKSSWNIMHYHVTFTLQWKLYNLQEKCLCIFLLSPIFYIFSFFLSLYLSVSLSHYPFTTPTSLSLLLITE